MRKTWAAGAGIALDHGGEVPIGVQLDWTIRAAVAGGRLRPGERLPGLRDIAGELGVSHNTLRAAVAKLEADGVLETRHGAGTFVAAGADARAAAQSALVDDTAARARAAGIAPRELAAALYVTGAAGEAAEPGGAGAGAGEGARAGGGTGAGSDADAEVSARRALRDELAVLDRILIDLEERLPERLPGGDYDWKPRGARLLTTDELRAQRDALIRRIADAQHALDAATSGSSPATEPAPEAAAEGRRGPRRSTAPRPGTAPA